MTDRPDLSDLLRDAVPQHSAPSELREWAAQQARAMDRPSADATRSEFEPLPTPMPTRRDVRLGGFAAALVAAMLVGWVGHAAVVRSNAGDQRTAAMDAIVDSHVRSLMLDHLVDVRSSDRHTVKPWFAGKTDIAPSVPELAPVGFPLLGGRLDYVNGHATPTLVYGRRQHVINLYIGRLSPSERSAQSADKVASRHGYHVLHWTANDLTYDAVSDVDPAELTKFREAYVAAR